MSWLFLAVAILSEVSATVSLRMLTAGRRLWAVPVVAGYLLSFGMLTLVLRGGVPVGVAYGIWSAAGVALTAIIGRIVFKEPLTWIMAAGIALIVGGVLLIETGAAHPHP